MVTGKTVTAERLLNAVVTVCTYVVSHVPLQPHRHKGYERLPGETRETQNKRAYVRTTIMSIANDTTIQKEVLALVECACSVHHHLRQDGMALRLLFQEAHYLPKYLLNYRPSAP